MACAELVRGQRLAALVATTNSEQRVAAFLLSLSERMRACGFSPNEFLLRMTQAEIGSYLGTTLETVSRSLSAFARRDFITVQRRQTHLKDVDATREVNAGERCEEAISPRIRRSVTDGGMGCHRPSRRP